MFDFNHVESIKNKFMNLNFQSNKEKSLNSCWIQTFSGKKFYPLNPKIEDIEILDIAEALSKQCRFSGHIKEFYSVAQHSVYVSYLCNKEDALCGLLHDASEAYLVDLPKPIKDSGLFDNYKIFEKTLQDLVYQKFCNVSIEPKSVKIADMIMLSTEAKSLLNNIHEEWQLPTDPLDFIVSGFSPDKAKEMFMNRFEELYGK